MVKALGYENFHFPATTDLLTRIPQTPDIMHCHNLHGEYFDLRMLPKLSKQLSVVMTLHDAWLFSGHCAHSFDCDRWKIGCGKCPDLSIPPAIQRDATVYNWRKKQQIYANSRLVIVTPSRWLMQKVEQSMLVPAIIRKQVIPNGIDLSVFYPTDKTTVRQKLGIPLDAYVCLFVAHGIHQNRWKDYQSLQTAMFEVSTSSNNSKNPYILLC
jgi:glycosyltransferase involved in cell wall biosynthesis